ncbi:hypothetical protein J4E85_000279 [Alternaria conjuncta]|uniref:uncharacterized protein n=1 Tax=Alternaria conjuncta TaxID=181017 RepID=UPI00221FD1F9|nr:uncharacterized protein J4E85_000279 [Alternaria conjuncta]KAI4937842.1 hypothetical protein J4E85_000279 [Alternaria conjuncta]
MFGPFRLTNPLSGGLLWKIPWRLSRHQKYRQRERLRHVDTVVGTLDTALRRMGQSMKKVERWKMEMPTEAEMLPKDKYTVFDRKVKRYRKGIHKGELKASAVEYILNLRSLTVHRGAKMDESQSTTQPSGFLDGPYRERRYGAMGKEQYNISNLHWALSFPESAMHTIAEARQFFLEILDLLKANTITVETYAQSVLGHIRDRDHIVKAWAHLALHLSKRQIKSLFYAELENLIMCHKIREDRCME